MNRKSHFLDGAIILFALSLMTFGTQHAIAQGCDDCYPTVSNWLYEGPCAYVLDDVDCLASIGPITSTAGAPGAPMAIESVICTACDSEQDQQTELTYSKTMGWTWCISFGAEFSWGIPAGPNWSINGGTEICFNNSTTTIVQVPVTCAAGTREQAVVFETTIPVTLTIPTYFDVEATYELATGTGCPATKVLTIPCDTVLSTRIVNQHTYNVVFTTLSCPAPGGGGGV